MAPTLNHGHRLISLVAVLVLLIFGGQLGAQQTTPSAVEIASGNALTGQDLRAAETKWFTIAVQADQLIDVVVVQKGIDVEIALTDPAGTPVARMDSPNAEQGPEPLVAVATVTGVYRIRVTAPPDVPPGKFDIKVSVKEKPSPDDLKRRDAERSIEHGYDLGTQQSAGSLERSIAELKKALQYYESSSDSYRRGIVLLSAGLAQAQSNHFQQAAEFYRRSFEAFQANSDQHMETMLLSNLATAYDALGDYELALSTYQRALPLARSGSELYNQAVILNNIGSIYLNMGRWHEADEIYSEALPLARRVGERQLLSGVLENKGQIHLELGEPDQALAVFQEELSVAEALQDGVRQGRALNGMGYAYSALQSFPKAMECYERASALEAKAGDKRFQGIVLRNIGLVRLKKGDAAGAVKAIQGALALLSQTDEVRTEAGARELLGEAYTQSNNAGQALVAFSAALSTFERIGDQKQQAKTLAGLARVQARKADFRDAIANSSQALHLIDGLRVNAGGQKDRTAFFANSQDLYTSHIDLLMQMNGREPNQGFDIEAFNTAERARARSLLEMLAETRVDFRQGGDPKLLERERELAQSLNSKSQMLLTLRGADSNEKAAALKIEISDLESEYQRVQLTIRKNSPEYAAITQPQPSTLKQVQQQVLDQDSLLLEYSLGEERSYLFVVSHDRLKTYNLPPRMQIDSAVRNVYQLLIARSEYKMGESLQEKQARIAKADREFPAAAAALSSMVLGPAAPELKNNGKRLVLVADGALQTVPFAVLPLPADGGSNLLIARHEIVSLPSASTISELRKEVAGRSSPPGLVAVFADPVFATDDPRVRKTQGASKQLKLAASAPAPASEDDSRMLEHLAAGASAKSTARLEVPRLPFTREEAARIAKMVPANQTFEALDFKASLPTVTSATLSRYRYLHFATHGYMDSERPELSSIVLSLVDQNGNPQDGFLRAQDIYNLKLNADLVVLSACQTGLGKEIRGEGIVGLTRGFMYAGAPRVIVSMWSVNDRSTEELMGAFYERLLKRGMRPSAALREAQLELSRSKKWSAPYYWGAFVQQGEWR